MHGYKKRSKRQKKRFFVSDARTEPRRGTSVSQFWQVNVLLGSPKTTVRYPDNATTRRLCVGYTDPREVCISSTTAIMGIFYSDEFLGQSQEPNFPSTRANLLVLSLDCSTVALPTPQKVSSICKLVVLKMLDFSDHTRTGISILTSAADSFIMGMM